MPTPLKFVFFTATELNIFFYQVFKQISYLFALSDFQFKFSWWVYEWIFPFLVSILLILCNPVLSFVIMCYILKYESWRGLVIPKEIKKGHNDSFQKVF